MSEERITPRPISFLTCCRAIPGLHAQFARKIPNTFWSLVGENIIVNCPCGHDAVLERYAVPTACACDRWYLCDGNGVRVARYESNDSVAA